MVEQAEGKPITYKAQEDVIRVVVKEYLVNEEQVNPDNDYIVDRQLSQAGEVKL